MLTRVYLTSFSHEISDPLPDRILEPRSKKTVYRRQILLIAKLGILHCGPGGIDLRRSSERFGSILLKVNDQFHHGLLPGPAENISDKERFARAIAELLAVTEYGKPNIGHQLARNQLLLTRYVRELESDSDYVDVAQEYENSVGILVEENTAILFGLHARSGRTLVETIKTNPWALPFGLQTFSHASVSLSKISSFLATIATTPAMMKRDLLCRDYGANDFTIFRKFPAVEQWYNPHLKSFWIGRLLLDHHMLIEKQLSGPYWYSFGNTGNDLLVSGASFRKIRRRPVSELLRWYPGSIYS